MEATLLARLAPFCAKDDDRAPVRRAIWKPTPKIFGVTHLAAVQAKFCFLLLDKFFSSLLCLLVTVILKVLNWGVYRSHEIFVMMKPGFLSNLNSCIPFKAWFHGWRIYNRSFTGKNILLDHKVESCHMRP